LVENKPLPEGLSNCWLRWALFIFGWINIGIGAVGIVVPGLPTTIFLIIALWAFSKSSDRFQSWLWNHPRFGPNVRHWHNHRVIPVRAKILAVAMMISSLAIIVLVVADDWVLPVTVAVVMIPAAIYVVTRASAPPREAVVAVDGADRSTRIRPGFGDMKTNDADDN